ncbi:MAG: Ig domain-containing protein, partial [Paludibacteraceae bacterium]|nr:Ig domain-containing protein [Paludibacteraceae bacterium]
MQDKKAECEYSVKETVITAIYLTNAGVKVGSKVTLIYSTDPVKVPAERLMWSSEDTNIATVNENGEVTGVKAGMVKIWAQCGTVKKFCSVTVSNAPVESVVIEPATAIIAKGETKQFSAHVLPEVAETGSLVYSWKSSNTSVATIDSKGLVTAKGVGESDITVTVDGKSATSKLTVKDNVVHVTSVSVTPSTYSADLIYGAPAPTKQLTAAVRPDNATDKTVTWTSSNTSVATVSSSGLVTCKGIGTATITATADGKKGTCTVTFNKIPVTSVSVIPSTYTAEGVVGSTKQLSATVSPVTATNKTVKWESNNTSVATVSSSGLVTCKGIGTATITATADGKKGTCTVTFNKI